MCNKFYGFVYLTTNKVNGKKYIGQRCYHKNGWEDYLGSGIHLKRAINKYGKENFTRDIIENYVTKEELDNGEKYWISKLDAINNVAYYNIAKGGDGGNTTYGYTEKEKDLLSKKLSDARKGKVNIGSSNGMAKKVILLNTMEIFGTLSEASKKYGIKHPEAISSCCNGKTKTSGKDKDGNGLIWRFYNDDEKYEYVKYDKTYKDRSTSRCVICLNTMDVYDTIAEASRDTGANSSKISNCCKGKQQYCGKSKETGLPLKWMYIENYINIKEKIDINDVKFIHL